MALLLDAPPFAGADSAVADGHQDSLATIVVSRARRLALNRLAEVADCRALFENLGHSGVQLVTDATFRRAGPREMSQICRQRKAIMFTTLRGSEIVLCLYNLRLQPVGAQAALLLHEALHHAGLSEQPVDPDGLSPDAITRLVELRCKL